MRCSKDAKSPHTQKNYKGREAEAWLTGFGDTSLNFELVVWLLPQAVKKPQQVRADYYWELETALTKFGIQLPATLAASILLREQAAGLAPAPHINTPQR